MVLPYPLEDRPEDEVREVARTSTRSCWPCWERPEVHDRASDERANDRGRGRPLRAVRALSGRGVGRRAAPVARPRRTGWHELLEGTPTAPDHVIVGRDAPSGGTATVEKIAVNAAMTGCLPEHLPFVIAGVEAICQPGYNLYGVGATTGVGVPDADRQRPVAGPRSASTTPTAAWAGRPAGARARSAGRWRCACATSAASGPGDHAPRAASGSRPASACASASGRRASPWPSFADQRGFSPDQDVVHAYAGMGTMPLCDNSTRTPGTSPTCWPGASLTRRRTRCWPARPCAG